ncbi:MAG: response regulator [Chloroflexi bacterium SZAS-1]|jgi:DNA-binding response OmpR family regulator|nr:response regulator [Chloroflexi bacterium SZAS-1]HNP86880.1 response regulator [Kouleothrix sp.]
MADPFDILIVDDDASICEQTSQLVALWGYRVRTAADISTALAALEQRPADIILTDLLLEHQPDYTLMHWSKAQVSPPPVLVMTAYASLEYAIEALKQGAYDFLIKPMTPPELEAALSRAGMAVSLRQARERHKHLQHIAEVALTLAHEINNPLAIILGELQLQLEEPDKPFDPVSLQACITATKRIAEVVRMISELHEVAYQEYGGLRLLDLSRGKQA